MEGLVSVGGLCRLVVSGFHTQEEEAVIVSLCTHWPMSHKASHSDSWGKILWPIWVMCLPIYYGPIGLRVLDWTLIMSKYTLIQYFTRSGLSFSNPYRNPPLFFMLDFCLAWVGWGLVHLFSPAMNVQLPWSIQNHNFLAVICKKIIPGNCSGFCWFVFSQPTYQFISNPCAYDLC